MAKTIEERANKKYNNPVEPYCCETDNEEQWYRCGLCDGYIEGATDQRKIDIEKACEWFETQISRGKGASCRVFFIDSVERFRKAMEEQP